MISKLESWLSSPISRLLLPLNQPYITNRAPPPPSAPSKSTTSSSSLCTITSISTSLFLFSSDALALSGCSSSSTSTPLLSVHATSMAENHSVSTSTMPVQHRGSHTTPTTTRPKIKIIHIIAPEIIKTDVVNFRDLVQRLTGKPTTGASSMMNMSPLPVEEDNKETVKKRPPPPAAPVTSDFLVQQEPSKKMKIKCEVKVEEGGFVSDYGLDCNDLWMDQNPGAGSFLSFLEEELDVFQGLQAADHDDFLQLPLGPAARMDLVGEMYAS